MEYKSVNRYLDKNKSSKKNPIYGFFIKTFICLIIFLSLLVFLKHDENGKQIIHKYLYENNISLPSINKWYKKYFGDITPFQNFVKDNTKLVFNEHLVYDNVSVYKNGIKATSITSIGQDIQREVFIKGTNGEIYIPDFQHAEKFIVKNDKKEEYDFPFEINGFEYQIKELIECIKEKKNESITYPASRSIRLMKLLYDIRMSWNMKFLFEE